MKYNLVWLRNDLRVLDNTALSEAVANGPSIAIYIACPEQWQLHHDAPIKLDFWRRNLETLKQELSIHNVPLHFFQLPSYKEVPALFEALLASGEIKALYFNNEYPLNERARDKQVTNTARQLNVDVMRYHDDLFCDPGSVMTKQGNPFKVFTPFSRAAKTFIPETFSPLACKKQNKITENLKGLFQQAVALEQIAWPEPEPWWTQQWPAGERHARKSLENFTSENIRHYSDHRDLPAITGTSMISPYLTSGVVSSRMCWSAAARQNSNDSVQRWKTELIWREFYRYVACHFSHVCKGQAWNQSYNSFPWRNDETSLHKWQQGETGVPIIDAAMKQLLGTGWMHNRLRMIVAMYLSKHLLIDWREGERWFMQHLVDGDFCSNNGGWQWSASTGTDAAPYFRIFNPVTQSERFDPEGKFIRQWIPELKNVSGKAIHDPVNRSGIEYYEPLVALSTGRERAINAFKQFQP